MTTKTLSLVIIAVIALSGFMCCESKNDISDVSETDVTKPKTTYKVCSVDAAYYLRRAREEAEYWYYRHKADSPSGIMYDSLAEEKIVESVIDWYSMALGTTVLEENDCKYCDNICKFYDGDLDDLIKQVYRNEAIYYFKKNKELKAKFFEGTDADTFLKSLFFEVYLENSARAREAAQKAGIHPDDLREIANFLKD